MSATSQRCLRRVCALAVLVLASSVPSPVSAAGPTLVGTIQLPDDGFGVAVNPLTGWGYVGLTGDVGVFSLDSNTYVDTMVLYPADEFAITPIAVNACSNKLYGGMKIVDLPSRTVSTLSCGGDDIAIDTRANRIYRGYGAYYQSTPDSVCVVDGRTGTRITTIELEPGYYREHVWVAVNAGTGRLYVSYSQDETLHVYETEAYTEVDSLAVADIGRVVVNPATNRVYVISGVNTLVLDGTSLEQLGQLNSFSGYLLVNPLTNRIYSVGYTLAVADGATSQVIGSVYVPRGAQAPALNPLTGRIYFVGAYAGFSNQLYVYQDVAPAEGAALPCPVAWPVFMPLALTS